jgi:hypothetical protein
LIVQDAALFLLSDVSAGASAIALQGMVLLIAVGLVFLARTASARGWIA